MSQANRLTDNQEGLSYVQDLERKLELSMEVVKAVAHIGIDWGFGKYELEDKFITQARELYESDDSVQNPTLSVTQK